MPLLVVAKNRPKIRPSRDKKWTGCSNWRWSNLLGACTRGVSTTKAACKLPAAFQQYFAALREKKLFVTSLDRRIAQIYPMAVWRQNEKFFDTYRDDPRIARNVAFNAADLGAEAEMDGQGRITFPPELRRELGIENAAGAAVRL